MAIAGIVWYLRSTSPDMPRYNPFANSQSNIQDTQYDPPSVFIPANGYATPTYDDIPETELIPPSLPPGLEP